uniref:Uncharacterized protein n=1 Tax=Glossina austeni TaxID=7395 RepID=A0A1A9VJR8_GLOAU
MSAVLGNVESFTCNTVATRAKAATIPQITAPVTDGTITAAAINNPVITTPTTSFVNEVHRFLMSPSFSVVILLPLSPAPFSSTLSVFCFLFIADLSSAIITQFERRFLIPSSGIPVICFKSNLTFGRSSSIAAPIRT